MALSEREELELLELEYRESLAGQQPEQAESGIPLVGGLLGRDQYSGISAANIGEEVGRFLPQMGGAAAGFALGGPLGAAIGAGGAEAARGFAQDVASRFGAAEARPYQELLAGPAQAAAGEALGAVGGVGLGALAKSGPIQALKSGATRVGSQIMRVATGIPEREGAAVLRDPGILSRALPMDEAAQLYKKGVGAAGEGTIEARRALTGKTYLAPEDAVNQFDEIFPTIGAANDTEVLSLRQSLMDTLNDTPMKKSKLRKLLSERVEKLDAELENRLPDWGGAKKAWREAKIGEEFSSWIPLNKNLSPNVLRTFAAGAAAAKSLAEGSAWGLPLLAGVSPRVWGGGIQSAAAIAGLAKPTYRVVAGPAATEAERKLTDYYNNAR